MARIPRRLLNAPHFHVINRSVRRLPIFIRRTDYHAFLAVLQDGLQRYPVQLLSYCLLNNHWHLVLEPAGTQALIDFMHWVTTTHAVRWHRSHRTVGRGPVYQGRYHAMPISAPDELMRACRYVERNALAASLVRRAEHWPWCSLAARVRGDEHVPLKPAPFFASAAWLHYVNVETETERIAGATTPDDWRDLHYLRGPSEPGPPAADRRPDPDPAETVENRYVPLDDGSQTPAAGGTDECQHLVGLGPTADHDQPDPHVERPEHLGVGDAAGPLQPAEDGRRRPAGSIE